MAAGTTPFQFGAPVPALLWESFEEVLRTNMRILVKDIATTLGQPEAPLLEAIKAQTVRPYLFEASSDADTELDMRCDFLCQRPDAPTILQRCGQPVLWCAATAAAGAGGIHRCTEHIYATAISRPAGLPRLLRLEGQPLFHDAEGLVKNGSCQAKGRYCLETKRLTLFEVEED
jgi:hypothetical protein